MAADPSAPVATAVPPVLAARAMRADKPQLEGRGERAAEAAAQMLAHRHPAHAYAPQYAPLYPRRASPDDDDVHSAPVRDPRYAPSYSCPPARAPAYDDRAPPARVYDDRTMSSRYDDERYARYQQRDSSGYHADVYPMQRGGREDGGRVSVIDPGDRAYRKTMPPHTVDDDRAYIREDGEEPPSPRARKDPRRLPPRRPPDAPPALAPPSIDRGRKRAHGEEDIVYDDERRRAPPRRREDTKRQRRECFRCGGRNHVVMVCTSTERDAGKNLALPQCSACEGRGHSPDNCPTVNNANPCYRCRQPGHFARNCPYDDHSDAPTPLRADPRGAHDPLGGGPDPRDSHAAMDPRSVDAQLKMFGYSNPAQLYAAYGMAANYNSYGYQAPAQQSWNYDYPPSGGGARGPQGPPPPSGGGGYQHSRPSRGSGGSGPPQIGRCFRCGEDGHWTRDCPQRPADADPNGCYKCGKQGHRSRECNACYRCGRDGHRAAECPDRD